MIFVSLQKYLLCSYKRALIKIYFICLAQCPGIVYNFIIRSLIYLTL